MSIECENESECKTVDNVGENGWLKERGMHLLRSTLGEKAGNDPGEVREIECTEGVHAQEYGHR